MMVPNESRANTSTTCQRVSRRVLGSMAAASCLMFVMMSGCESAARSGPLDHSLDGQSAAVEAAGGKMEIHLDFARAGITDEDLATLPLPATTTRLNLSYTKITDDGLQHLERFTQLEELRIASTEITDAGLEHLMKLDSLRLIDADQSAISRKGQLKLLKFLAPRAQAHAIAAPQG